VFDTYRELCEFEIEAMVHDPLADPSAVRHEYGIELASIGEFAPLDALIYAVAHDDYAPHIEHVSAMIAHGGVIADVRSRIDPATLRADIVYWSL
jgi:UDP-N-acetyl-D-glucosamine/UDP-N-acetyl-D-galactosamine dehydrogenase